MGVKLVVFNDEDPGVGATFDYVPRGTPGLAHGWRGMCTQCGKPMHFWTQESAFEHGQAHVNSHTL
jgi:hypothetical protein